MALALSDSLGGHAHHHRQPDRDDRPLADVQQRKCDLALDRRRLVALQPDVEAPRLVVLVAEVLDGLVVEQAVDRLGVGVAVGFVHLAAVLDPPFGDRERPVDVTADGREGDRGEHRAVEPPQDAAHQQHLEQGRQHVEQHEVQQELDAAHAALDGAAHPAGLAVQVEPERQAVQMAEGGERHGAHGALAHFGEHRVAQLAEALGEDAGDGVGDDEEERHRERRRGVERVDRALVEQRHADVGELGRRQQRHRRHDPQAQLGLALGPQVGQQRAHRADVGLVAGRRADAGLGAAPHAAHGGLMRRNGGRSATAVAAARAR